MVLLRLLLVLLVLGATLASAIGNGASSLSDLITTTTTTITRHSFVAVTPGAVASVPSWNSSSHSSFKLGAENKTSATFNYISSSARTSHFVSDTVPLANSVADRFSALSTYSTLSPLLAVTDVIITYFPVRYPGISSVASSTLATTSVSFITTTVTNTSIYTRTISVTVSPIHQVVEPDLEDENCMLSTVLVTVASHITVSTSASSSISYINTTPVHGSSSSVVLLASQASGATITGVAAPAVAVSSFQHSGLTETHSTLAIPATLSASPDQSSSVRANPSTNPGQTNNTDSILLKPSTSPFLTPNHPYFNMTVAGAGRGAEVHTGVTLSLILAFIGSMVLFAN